MLTYWQDKEGRFIDWLCGVKGARFPFFQDAKPSLDKLDEEFEHEPLTREEEAADFHGDFLHKHEREEEQMDATHTDLT